MTQGKRWADMELPIDAISQHADLQFRADGLSLSHVNKLVRTLEADGGPLEPVRVARIGKALYLVDGHHRLEAHRRLRKATIPAKVARMSIGEAKDAARLANTRHGKSLTRADKALIWQSYVDAGKHLDIEGLPRASRAIAAELGQMYSHETVRQKLSALGLELDDGLEFPGGYSARFRPDEEDVLEEALAEELEEALRRFGGGFGGLTTWHRRRLLRVAQGMLEALEKGEEPDMLKLLQAAEPF